MQQSFTADGLAVEKVGANSEGRRKSTSLGITADGLTAAPKRRKASVVAPILENSDHPVDASITNGRRASVAGGSAPDRRMSLKMAAKAVAAKEGTSNFALYYYSYGVNNSTGRRKSVAGKQ